MSTPPSEQPRLPDADKAVDDEQPDFDRAHHPRHRARIGEDEAEERIPEPDE